MIHVNPSPAAFLESKNSSFYIDKSMLIAELNKRGDLLFVGINYDENTKCHTCKIQKLKA